MTFFNCFYIIGIDFVDFEYSSSGILYEKEVCFRGWLKT